MFSRWRQNSTFDAPSLSDAVTYEIAGKAHFYSPLISRKPLSSESNPACFPCVLCLLARRGPAAVPWFVIAKYVFPVNRMESRGPRPHIRVETPKRSCPSPAHGYPACAVVLIASMFRVGASAFHSFPDLIFRMARKTATGLAAALASTRLGISAPKIGNGDGFEITAVAETIYNRYMLSDVGRCLGNVLAEARTNVHSRPFRATTTGIPSTPCLTFSIAAPIAATSVTIVSAAGRGGKLMISQGVNLRRRFANWLGPYLRSDLTYGPLAL